MLRRPNIQRIEVVAPKEEEEEEEDEEEEDEEDEEEDESRIVLQLIQDSLNINSTV
jgi:hypothetical protein